MLFQQISTSIHMIPMNFIGIFRVGLELKLPTLAVLIIFFHINGTEAVFHNTPFTKITAKSRSSFHGIIFLTKFIIPMFLTVSLWGLCMKIVRINVF